jgi:hypothetical protein
VIVIASVPCACGGVIDYCEDEDGDAIVAHSAPSCDWFNESTTDEYRTLLENHPAAKRAVMDHRKGSK